MPNDVRASTGETIDQGFDIRPCFGFTSVDDGLAVIPVNHHFHPVIHTSFLNCVHDGRRPGGGIGGWGRRIWR